MEAETEGRNIPEKLSGFIFMCNRITKPECYRFRVFGLPAGRKGVVEKIIPGTYLFLFDTDVKLLYGTYMATSTGRLKIEPLAFGGRFPAQVSFKIYKDCLPLPENCFKHAIHNNYQKDSNKFDPELNITQVRSLLELFRPLHVLSTAPTHLGLKNIYPPSTLPLPPVNNVLTQIPTASHSKDLFLFEMSPNQAPMQLNYKHVHELKEPTGYAYPVTNLMPNSATAQSVPSQASMNQLHATASTLTSEGTYAELPNPQYSHQNFLNPQPQFHSSLDSQHAHYGILHSLQAPQHSYQAVLNPPPNFYSSAANVSNSHAQYWDPHYTHQNIVNHSSTVNMSSSYAQSLPYPQYTHQNPQNLQPDFNSSLVNMGYANVAMQSYASSSLYYPYAPQEVVPATHVYQGSGAIQGAISSAHQTGTGSEYYQPSMQREMNISNSTQENVTSHISSANSYSQG